MKSAGVIVLLLLLADFLHGQDILFSYMELKDIDVSIKNHPPKQMVSFFEKNDSLLDYRKKPISIGLHFLYGEGFNMGSFGEYYSPDLSMSFGGDLSYKKILASFDVTSYRHQLQKIYVGKKTFEESAGTDIINLNFGYRIIDLFKFKLTPFAGIARIEFSSNNSLNEL